jgi:hypothetical protein
MKECCNWCTAMPSFPSLCPAAVALRRPDSFIHIRCPPSEYAYRTVLRRRRLINPQTALTATEPSPSSHRCCMSLHVDICSVPKSDLNAATKFHASVGVVTGLCAGRFGVRFLLGTRGISHLQNGVAVGPT